MVFCHLRHILVEPRVLVARGPSKKGRESGAEKLKSKGVPKFKGEPKIIFPRRDLNMEGKGWNVGGEELGPLWISWNFDIVVITKTKLP